MEMDIINRVVKNTILLSLVKIINPLVSFFLIMLVARYENVSFLGNYSLIQAFSGIFVMISCLGLEILIMRDVSKKESQAGKYIVNSIAILFFSGLFFALIMSCLAYILGYEKDVRMGMYIASIVLIPANLSVVFWGIFKAYEKNIYFTIIAIIENILRVGLSIVALFHGCGLAGLFSASLGSSFVGLFLGFYFIKKKIISKIQFEVDFKLCKGILKSTFAFAMIGIVVSLYWRIGIIILEKIEGASAVGIFSAGFRLFNIIESLVVAFGLSVFPNISRKFEMRSCAFENISVDSARYIIIVVFLFGVLTTFLAGDIIRLIYGSKFRESVFVLQVLVWATVPFSLVTVFAYSLISSYHQKVDLVINVIGLLCNIILCLLLIPRFSYLGLAFALVGSTCVLLICQRVFINEKLFRLRLTKIMGPPFLSSVAMIVCILILRPIVNLYFLLLGATLVYFYVLYISKGLNAYEINYLRRFSASLIQSWKLSLLGR